MPPGFNDVEWAALLPELKQLRRLTVFTRRLSSLERIMAALGRGDSAKQLEGFGLVMDAAREERAAIVQAAAARVTRLCINAIPRGGDPSLDVDLAKEIAACQKLRRLELHQHDVSDEAAAALLSGAPALELIELRTLSEWQERDHPLAFRTLPALLRAGAGRGKRAGLVLRVSSSLVAASVRTLRRQELGHLARSAICSLLLVLSCSFPACTRCCFLAAPAR